MKELKLITIENIPCWYEISWLEKRVGILLKIHRDFADIMPIIPKDSPIVEYFMKKFEFSRWAGNLKNDFGFDNSFIYQGENGNFIDFLVPIPKVKKYTRKPCSYCNGTGKDIIDEERNCGFCNGTGKRHFIDWHAAQAVSASFNTFLNFALYPASETSSPFPQLMEIQVATDDGMHGGSINGEFSIPFYEWLNTFEEGTIFPDVIKAMQITEKRMFGKYDNFGFRSYILYKGVIGIDVPGTACGIYNSLENIDYGQKRGCKLECHNVDTAMQQIELLVALAVLHDHARKEIKTY